MSEWISVKDKLPTESDGTVLICLPDKSPYNLKEPFVNAKHNQRIVVAHYSEFSKRWYADGGSYPTAPIYWMPLPEPPKGENVMNEELKPCPFCGNEHPTITDKIIEGVLIRCPHCNITFTRDFYEHRGKLGRQETIKAWNRRTTE